MLFVGTSIIHPSTEGVFLLCNILDLLIYSCKNRIIKLRESTGLNRKDFCKLVHIPYRTMTEWELDNRHAPDYVLWLLEYYIRNEGLMVKEMNEGGGDSEKETT